LLDAALALPLVAGFALPLAAAQAASNYPAKPIRLIALSSPGSGPDVVGRLIGAKFSESMGQQVVVDTRPGATGIIGAEIAARAAPDGYTLVIITSQQTIVSVMYDNLSYNLQKDFTPISLVGRTPFILAVNPKVPARSMRELIDLAKSRPGELRYGSGGQGSPPHLSAELLKRMAGIDMQHIPYKGVTPAMAATMAGEVDLLISVIPAILSTVREGKLRALGVTSAKRATLVPDVPAIAETLPGYEFIGWYSIFAPKGTPAPIIGKLNQEIVSAVQTPAMTKRLLALGIEPMISTPRELADYLAAQVKKMRVAVEAAGARRDR
jgi:tripartite-type tricarboxylate transporter receptor subunit TctC